MLSDEQIARKLTENLESVRGGIDEAALTAGRSADQIALVAVTKYVDSRVARMLLANGQTVLGESRPQVLWEKAADLSDLTPTWHMIGHLQRNKLKRTLPVVDWIHSGDSMRLLNALNAESTALNRRVNVLLEVNISGDASKHGFAADELAAALAEMTHLNSIQISGLMGMSSRGAGPDQARREFSALRELRDRLLHDCPDGISLTELSMGMSGDFREAILEGSTMVRIGSSLYSGIHG